MELTPEAMAEKLCEDFYAINLSDKKQSTDPYISRSFAKQCASIMIEGLINETRKKYWYAVKEALNNITKWN
jgi:hypothetical protein